VDSGKLTPPAPRATPPNAISRLWFCRACKSLALVRSTLSIDSGSWIGSWFFDSANMKEPMSYNLLPTFLSLTSSARLVALGPSSPRVYRVPSHRVRPIDAVQLKVQPTGVAHHFSAHISSPNRCRRCATIGAGHVLLRAIRVLVIVQLAGLLHLGPLLAIVAGDRASAVVQLFRRFYFDGIVRLFGFVERRPTRTGLFSATRRFVGAVIVMIVVLEETVI
jgi:hypothetical protein